MTFTCLHLLALLSILHGTGTLNSCVRAEVEQELIHYKLRYSIFQVGMATVSCEKDSEGAISRIRVVARSNGIVRLFNDMHYQLECKVDRGTGLPESAVINLNDRKHNLYNELVFQQDARPDSALVSSSLSGDHVVSKNIYEILTGFYHFRKDLIPENPVAGREAVIKTFYPDKPWDLIFTYAFEEELKTALGVHSCYKFNPGTIAGRFFEREDAMSVWFTKEKPYIPVRFRLDLRIGALHGLIVDYSD